MSVNREGLEKMALKYRQLRVTRAMVNPQAVEDDINNLIAEAREEGKPTRTVLVIGGDGSERVAKALQSLASAGTEGPGLASAAWDMLHAVEAADAAGELAENIGGELIDALRAALARVEGEKR